MIAHGPWLGPLLRLTGCTNMSTIQPVLKQMIWSLVAFAIVSVGAQGVLCFSLQLLAKAATCMI